MAKRNYIVQTNDTLSIIARDETGDISRWQEIAYINSIKAPYTIYPGQVILVPEIDDPPIEIKITDYAKNDQAAPVRKASIVFNPATVALIVAGAALLYFWDEIF
jgi:LysM repeat protein